MRSILAWVFFNATGGPAHSGLVARKGSHVRYWAETEPAFQQSRSASAALQSFASVCKLVCLVNHCCPLLGSVVRSSWLRRHPIHSLRAEATPRSLCHLALPLTPRTEHPQSQLGLARVGDSGRNGQTLCSEGAGHGHVHRRANPVPYVGSFNYGCFPQVLQLASSCWSSAFQHLSAIFNTRDLHH
jgi:hypothetical protein